MWVRFFCHSVEDMVVGFKGKGSTRFFATLPLSASVGKMWHFQQKGTVACFICLFVLGEFGGLFGVESVQRASEQGEREREESHQPT